MSAFHAMKDMNPAATEETTALHRRVMMYLDGALDAQEAEALRGKLESDPELRALMERERSFRALLRASWPRQTVSPALADGIRAQLDDVQAVAPTDMASR